MAERHAFTADVNDPRDWRDVARRRISNRAVRLAKIPRRHDEMVLRLARMKPARSRLEQSLEALDIELASLVRCHPEEAEFWPRFTMLADDLVRRSDPVDQGWLTARIVAMLTTHGVSGVYPMF